MGMVSEQNKFLADVARLITESHRLGIVITGGELWRTEEQQRIYVETGRSKTINSGHRNRLAIDLNFFIDGVLTYEKAAIQPLGDYWESLDPRNTWGGNWKFRDVPHFERRLT